MLKRYIVGFKKGFAIKETAIVIAVLILLILGIMAFAISKSMSNSIDLAKETKYISYISQMQKIIERANALAAFSKIETAEWVCLGAYSGSVGDSCWDGAVDVIANDEQVDKALAVIESIPKGQLSPYKTFHDRGVIFKINQNSIDIKAYVGDAKRTSIFCKQLHMIQDPQDSLSCILSSPIVKN